MRSMILITLLPSCYVQANLLIAPTKIAFEDRQRSTEIILINNGDETRSYRMGWREMSASTDSGYQILNAQQIKEFPIASSMIRFSPKQVTLKPGDRQIIKMALRRPKGLQDGEYRSHLLLTALPPKQAKNSEKTRAPTIALQALISYSLPVVVRQGAMQQPELSIGAIDLTYRELKKDSYVEKQETLSKIRVEMNRTGLFSANGNLIAYWQAKGDKEEKIVAQGHDLTIYAELNKKYLSLTWRNAPMINGQLRLAYEGRKKLSDTILAEKTIEVTASSFKKINE